MRSQADEEDEYKETAIGYAVAVLTYMQNGGKLSSIESTASEIVRLAGQELERETPGPVRAEVLMGSVEEMRFRHNNLNADAVFEDMMAQARNAGRLRSEGE